MSHPAYKPPPAFCTKAEIAKGGGGGGGGVFAGHYGITKRLGKSENKARHTKGVKNFPPHFMRHNMAAALSICLLRLCIFFPQ